MKKTCKKCKGKCTCKKYKNTGRKTMATKNGKKRKAATSKRY